uniref:Uncharacterized protein n=1 Tax=Anguilla anguilla TaxID=7936 RepID=A0A0E9XUV1_ANGAN
MIYEFCTPLPFFILFLYPLCCLIFCLCMYVHDIDNYYTWAVFSVHLVCT